MAAYSYIAADLVTNAILNELPLRNVKFSHVLNAAGDFSGEMPLGDSKVTQIDPIGSTTPRRTALYIERDGSIVWGGIIWTRHYDSRKKVLVLGGNGFFSYFGHRSIRATAAFAATDQLAIVRSIINTAQTISSIGVTVGTETSGVLRDRTYYGYERKKIDEAITQLSQVEGGFDFGIDCRYDSSHVVQKYLTLSYPRRGRIAKDTTLFFDFPGNIVDYVWPEDGTNSANLVDAIGSGEADAMLISTAADAGEIQSGAPLLETFTSYKDVSVQSTLDAHAQADLQAFDGVVTLPTATVRADREPILGSYIEGDEAEFRILDERFPTITASFQRITSYSVKVPDDDKVEDVSLTLQAV